MTRASRVAVAVRVARRAVRAADQATSDEGVPSWIWWLLAGLLVVGAVVVVGVMRARRRSRWRERLEAAETEVAWLARELLPQLRDTGSLERVAGGWQVGLPRVTALEDELTVLESSTKKVEDAARARTLRDAVRSAHARVDSLVAGGGQDIWALDLDEVVALLESALAPGPQAE